jgi:hydroxypyruvate reductase
MKPETLLRRDAGAILRASLRAADPQEAVLRRRPLVERHLQQAKGRVFVVGAGKAAAAMGRAIERIAGRRIATGHLNIKDGHGGSLRRIAQHECGHPMPDARGVAGAVTIARLAQEAAAGDLVICLISGGASALMPLPAPGLTLEDKQGVTRLLLECGATIHEINTVRKHLSAIKGGQLARLASPARVLTLVLSDVVGDDLSVIGSGPTWPDASAFADARAVLRKYGIEAKAPAAVVEHLRQARQETPKPGDPAFARTETVIVGSNALAVQAAAREAKARGYRPLILSTTIEGETREIARMHAEIAREVRIHGRPVKAPACLISGGETTVTLRGAGQGGRNQEFAAAAAQAIDGLAGVCVLSAGTDGTDGPTDAAGAVVTGGTAARARAQGLSLRHALEENDAYPFFDALGDLVRTGPTGTNVMDVRLMLIG